MTSESNQQPSEKRRYERFPNTSIEIAVSRPGLGALFRANPKAECLNFSRTGISFDCDRQLDEGDRLLVDIAVDDIMLEDLKAKVVVRRALDDTTWCYGARFCLEDPKMNQDRVYHNLLLMEQRLREQQEFS